MSNDGSFDLQAGRLRKRPPAESQALPIPADNSFVVLSSGEVLPLDSQDLFSSNTNNRSSNNREQRHVNFQEPETDQSADEFYNFDDVESDFPAEADDEQFDDEDIEELDEEEYMEPDDEPSTSAGIRRRPGGISTATKAALMSGETADLLKEIRSAYEKKRHSRRQQRGARYVDDDADEFDEEEEDSDDPDDDPLDEDFFPSLEEKKRRTRTARNMPSVAAKSISKKRKSRSKTPQRTSEEFRNIVAGGMFDSMSDDRDRPYATDREAFFYTGGNSAAKKTPAKTTLSRHERDAIAWNDFLWSDTDMEDDLAPKRRRNTHKLPPEAESLLGQANVSFAQGRREEALKMVEEVIRRHPNYYESYDVLSMFHGVMGNKSKQLHFGLLAGHLQTSNEAEKWVELAELAQEIGERENAIRCYTKAHRAKPTKWEYYEAKIKLLEEDVAQLNATNESKRQSLLRQISDTKLAAVKGLLPCIDVIPTDAYVTFVEKYFKEFYENNDVRGSIVCLKSILERGKLDGDKVMYDFLNNLMAVAMHAKDYEAALLAVFRYSKLQAFNGVDEVNLSTDRMAERIERHCQTRPLTGEDSNNFVITHYTVPQGFNVDLMAKTITCWIRLKRYDCCERLLEMMRGEVAVHSAPDIYWEIAEALADTFHFTETEGILELLIRTPEYEKNTAVWLCFAEVLSAQGQLESASTAFSRVVQLSPQHISARLSLSALQQQFGQAEEALQTLDIGDGRSLAPETMDARILYHRCLLLRQQESWNDFIMTGRYLMAMYFKDMYSYAAWNIVAAIRYGGWKVSLALRTIVMDAVRDTIWERLVKRIARVDGDPLSTMEIWDIFFQLCELLFERRMFTDLFYVCCFASQCPIFTRGNRLRMVLNLLLYTAILKRHAKVAWTLLRYCLPANNSSSAWNVHGLLFVFSQEVRYHKFTLRAMLRIPESVPLAWLSGNNSLISGTYQHALAEYYYILKLKPNDPLLNLLCALCNLHLATKKFIARRHDLFIQALAFLCKYEEIRGPCQEVYYNIGRAMQQAGVLYAAVHYYNKALAMEPMDRMNATEEDEEQHKGVGKSMYDLRPLIAHNLALIYQNSNNVLLARELMERYCTIE